MAKDSNLAASQRAVGDLPAVPALQLCPGDHRVKIGEL